MSRGRGKNIFTKSRQANQTGFKEIVRKQVGLQLPEIKKPDRDKNSEQYLELPKAMALSFGFDNKVQEVMQIQEPLKRLSAMQGLAGRDGEMFAFSEAEAQKRWLSGVWDRLERFNNLDFKVTEAEIEKALLEIGRDFTAYVADVGMEEVLAAHTFSSNPVYQKLGENIFALDCAWGQEDTVNSPGKQAMHFAADQLMYQGDNRRAPMMKDSRFNGGWALYQDNKNFFNAWALAQYQCTQDNLIDSGVERAIVYRLQDDQISTLNPLAASSFNYGSVFAMANDWMQTENSDVWTMEVPVERIFSTCATGFGELYQTEAVILPGRECNKASEAEIMPYQKWAKEYKPE